MPGAIAHSVLLLRQCSAQRFDLFFGFKSALSLKRSVDRRVSAARRSSVSCPAVQGLPARGASPSERREEARRRGLMARKGSSTGACIATCGAGGVGPGISYVEHAKALEVFATRAQRPMATDTHDTIIMSVRHWRGSKHLLRGSAPSPRSCHTKHLSIESDPIPLAQNIQ